MPRLRNLCRGIVAFWLFVAAGLGCCVAQQINDPVGARLTALEKVWNPPAPSSAVYAFDPVGARLDALESVAHPIAAPIMTDPIGARLAALEAVAPPSGGCAAGAADLSLTTGCNVALYLGGFL